MESGDSIYISKDDDEDSYKKIDPKEYKINQAIK